MQGERSREQEGIKSVGSLELSRKFTKRGNGWRETGTFILAPPSGPGGAEWATANWLAQGQNASYDTPNKQAQTRPARERKKERKQTCTENHSPWKSINGIVIANVTWCFDLFRFRSLGVQQILFFEFFSMYLDQNRPSKHPACPRSRCVFVFYRSCCTVCPSCVNSKRAGVQGRVGFPLAVSAHTHTHTV